MTSGHSAAPAAVCSAEQTPLPLDQLVAKCVQAPCGVGAETVVDTSIRRTLETQEVRVDWPGLQAALDECSRRLCPWLQLEARFYKVLVYQPGDFFRSHVDSKRLSVCQDTTAPAMRRRCSALPTCSVR